MTNMIFKTSSLEKTLFSSLLESRRLYGAFSCVLEDMTRKTLTYAGLLLKAFMIARLFTKRTQLGESVGLMLPNSHGLLISFWALQAAGRTPALLNYTSGSSNLLAACQASQVTHVYTSRLLVEKARLQEALTLLKQHKLHIHYLEDEIKRMTLRDKLWGIYGMFFPEKAYQKLVPFPQPHDRCVILFTSGTEGAPKGVVLSHVNLQANRYQLASVVDFNGNDKVFNVLPLFHAFGLVGGMLVPLLSGIKSFHYVSPLHYRTVAELVYDFGATILYGTNTFLFGYGRVAHPYDFHTIRYVFAGAEKLKEETQKLWFDKFGVRIFEGYGVTETSPVLCVNTAVHYKAGTVGQFLPGISYRLEPIEGLSEGGRLWVQGPNIMEGYLLIDSPGRLIPPQDRWYDTGDIVEKDPEGFIRFLGRAKRFAKVGGEMVSLAAIEEAVGRLWPGHTHAVLAQPDPRKGEKLILFTNYSSAEKETLAAFWREKGLSELSLPRTIYILSSLPLLGSGKVDYKALEKGIKAGNI